MSENTEDPVLLHLRERKAALEAIVSDATSRLNELAGLIAALTDGRSRVRRKLKWEVLPEPEPTAPADPPTAA